MLIYSEDKEPDGSPRSIQLATNDFHLIPVLADL